MKKYLKSLAKKSMSLFLAVVMLMSCWVWVAPPMKAEAADSPHEGYYYVQVFGNYHDWTDGTGVQVNDWIVTYKDAAGAEKTTTLSFVQDPKYGNHPNIEGAALNNIIIAAGWVPGFPTKVHHDYNVSCGGDGFGVQPRSLLVGSVANTTSKSGTEVATYSDQYSANSDGGYDIFNVDTGAHAPYAKSVTSAVAVENKSISVPSLGTTTNGSASFTKGGVYDQYGVRIKDLDGYNLYSDNGGTTTAYTPENGVWVNGTTVYASADAQKGIPNASGSQKIYLFGEGSGVKGLLAEITLTYPSYTLTVNPVGSVTASGFNPTIILNNNSTQTGNWTHNGPYGSAAATYPNGEATATGYEFKGFWTVKQPTTGDAGIDASAATFAEPVNQATFDTYKAQEGAVVDGSYVTLADGKKYYNAGTQWAAATHREILGTNTFYGWWIPQDITVKFYDIDGAFLGSKTAKYGSTPAADWYLNPKDGYNAGAYDYQGFAGKWRDITGVEVGEGSYTFGDLEELSLTPIYTKKTYSDKYQVNFVNPADGNNISGNSKEYEYRYILKDTDIPTVAVPSVLVNDPGYSYEFGGWTSQKPAKGNYHTVAKDDTAITNNTDWVVRDEITYYAIFRSTVKEYLVNFNYTDSTGAAKTESLTVPYGSAIATPNVVNRTYATGGYGYTLEGWDYQTNTGATVMLGADATLVFDNTKVFITTNNLAPSGTPIVFTANYDEGTPTPYTVTFKFKDAEGKDKVITDEVYHGYAITQDTVDRVTVPAQYDDGTALYTFSNLWKVTEGTAEKAEYTKDEFTSFKPVSHVTFEALYGEGVPFYTVTYIDGANKYEERVLAGNNVPAWSVEVDGVETEYAPAMADTETGKYNFEGWFDEKQTDKDFAQTNGTEYTTASIVNGDLVLYPQFKFEPFKFTIKFMNYDGTVQLAAAEVEAGKSFEAAFAEAQRAAQYRDADETYSYEFIGWDHKVPDNYLCEGKDMTYTALYKPNYVYYEANWYNDASMSGDPLATTKHTYNSSVYAPAVKLTLPEAETGKTTVFAGWKYLKDGVETDYVRGMKITAGMSFYATYDYVNKAVTLTTVVGTVETKHSVEYNKKANIGNPADGYVDATSHKKFAGWYTDAAYKNAFDMANTALTADTTIYAKFDTAAHSKTMKELVSAPTYYATGSEIIWCECNREETDETVELPMLTDTKAPTGTIYLGGHSWSSTGTPAYTTDNDPISIFVNANADIVITSNDTGDVNTAYNPSGIGKGVAKIRAFAFPADTVLTADNYGAAQSLAVDVYTNNTQDLNNNANFSIKVGDIFVADLAADGSVQYDDQGNVKFKDLEDGESYIIYYYVNDKAGNQLNRLVRTAKFTYDNTPAEITVAGDSNAETTTSTVTYCGKAVIKGIENGSTVLVNGEEVELTTSGAAGTSNYTITEAGNYAITVTDKAGNTSTKKIIVADGHDEIATSKAVTCTEDGYEKVICAVCGKVIKNETIESEGHKYSAEVTVAPTCTEDGYKIKTCSVCGDEVKTPGEAKTGHTYNKDADGNVIYVTVTPSTCKVKGKAEAKCTVCGEGKLEKELELDTVNGHKYGATKVLKATCTQDGEEYQNCKYCYAKKTVKVLEKLNHVGTGTYTKVTTAPTCYAEGVETTYCKGCDVVLSTAPVAKVAHTLVLVKYEGENNDDVANYPYGYMQYECKATGCTHTEGKTAIVVKAEYTVTFVGAGAEGADVVIKKTEGESIEANAVADQTKASDNEYDYTFKGWKAESTGKIVKLPVKVTKNETYTADFTATKRVYTHKFKINKDDQADFAVIIGTYNSENKRPAAIPTKAATPTERYEFTGWKTVLGAEVDNFTMTGDETFVAEFKTIKTEFNAIFYNEDNNLIWHTSVTANEAVKYANTDSEGNLIVPKKAADADAHYDFAGWKYDGTVYGIGADIANNLTNNIRIYATYTAVAHTFEVVNDETKTWAATCEKAGQTTEECSVCGYEKVTATPVVDHDYEVQADGSKKCSVCGDTIAPEAKLVKLTFKYGDDKSFTIEVAEGKEYKFTATEKKDTAEFDYEFSHWEDEAGNVVSEDPTITVTAGDKNATYTAVYPGATRYYYVTYVNWDYTTLQSFPTKYAYGATIPAYTNPAPTRNRDNTNHYIFEGVWSEEANATVTGDMVIIARFTAEKHDTERTISEAATCTKPATTYQACSKCDYREVTGTTGTTLPHTPKAGTEVIDPAGYNKPGTRTFECESCGQTITETLAAIPADIITVRVYDNDGKLAVNGAARVELYEIVGDKEIFFQAYDTNDKGEVEFAVEKGKKWKAGVTGDNMEGGYGGEVKHGLNIFGKAADAEPEKPSDTSCSCSCHKNTFWGIIYRFFQKLVMWLTGSPKCCGNPDPRIW